MENEGRGWEQFRTGVFVLDEDAFDYALKNCFEIIPEGIRQFQWAREFKEMLVEWFYSDNWNRKD